MTISCSLLASISHFENYLTRVWITSDDHFGQHSDFNMIKTKPYSLAAIYIVITTRNGMKMAILNEPSMLLIISLLDTSLLPILYYN